MISRSQYGLEHGVIPVAGMIKELDQIPRSNLSFYAAEVRGLAAAVSLGDPHSSSSELSSPPMSPRLGLGIRPFDYPLSTTGENDKSDCQPSTIVPLLLCPPKIITSPPPQSRNDSFTDSSISPTTETAPDASEHKRLESIDTIAFVPVPVVEPAVQGSSPILPLVQRFSDHSALVGQPHSPIAALTPSKLVQQYDFERRYFRNSVTLFDMHATGVEYTVPTMASNQAKAMNIELVKVMNAGRICLVRQQKSLSKGRFSYSTSIWSFSNDMTVRLEQKRESSSSRLMIQTLTLDLQSRQMMRYFLIPPVSSPPKSPSRCPQNLYITPYTTPTNPAEQHTLYG
jgi:hypothetical protein